MLQALEQSVGTLHNSPYQEAHDRMQDVDVSHLAGLAQGRARNRREF
jgi:hypothetical protein